MCDKQKLRPACAYGQSDQSYCLSLEYSMAVELLTEHHLEFLSLKGGCTGLSESRLVKMPHCLKSHVTAHIWASISCFNSHHCWRICSQKEIQSNAKFFGTLITMLLSVCDNLENSHVRLTKYKIIFSMHADNFNAFFVFCCFFLLFCFLKINVFNKFFQVPSECHIIWIQIKLDILKGLIWVQNAYKGYQQMPIFNHLNFYIHINILYAFCTF